jgi:hypothetical protein
MGGVTWVPESEVRSRIQLEDAAGGRHAPLASSEINPDARNLAAMMKPVFANMLGPMGESTAIFFFTNAAADGRPIAEEKQEGRFSILLGDERFEWRLPLASVFPRKQCPVDGESWSGAWRYCPRHGNELVSPPQTAEATPSEAAPAPPPAPEAEPGP